MDSADKPRARFPRPAKRGEGGTQRAQRDAGPRKRGEGNALLPFARPELEAEVERWLEYLGGERRYSPKTLEAYARDARQLLAFLAGHLGQKLTLTDLAKLEPRDVRAFLAARRAEGLTSRSLMRALAGARSARSPPCARQNSRRPCPSRSPSAPPSASWKPSCAPAKIASPGFSRATPRCWPCCTAPACASRKRSCSSATQCPNPAEATPYWSPARATRPEWSRCCSRCCASLPITSRAAPMRSPPTARCSWAPGAGRCRPGSCSWRWPGCAVRSRCRRARPRMRCGIPSPPTCWRGAAICARSRSCSATPRFRPRRSIPRSMPSGWSKSIATRIRGLESETLPTAPASPLRAPSASLHRRSDPTLEADNHGWRTRASRARRGSRAPRRLEHEDRAPDLGPGAIPGVRRDAGQERTDRGPARQHRGGESVGVLPGQAHARDDSTDLGRNHGIGSRDHERCGRQGSQAKTHRRLAEDGGSLPVGSREARGPQGAGGTSARERKRAGRGLCRISS